jgi:hypothetical protein
MQGGDLFAIITLVPDCRRSDLMFYYLGFKLRGPNESPMNLSMPKPGSLVASEAQSVPEAHPCQARAEAEDVELT